MQEAIDMTADTAAQKHRQYHDIYSKIHAQTLCWVDWKDQHLVLKNVKDAIDIVADLGEDRAMRISNEVRFKNKEDYMFYKIKCE